MNTNDLKSLQDQATAAHQAAGYAYGIALANVSDENKQALTAAKHEMQRTSAEYRKAYRAFYAQPKLVENNGHLPFDEEQQDHDDNLYPWRN